MHLQYQQHQRQNCHWYQRHQQQILPPGSLVLLIPVANLPPVSTTPAANLLLVSMTPVAICHWYQRHWWQIMGKISGCWDLKVNLKAKMYLYINSTSQWCPNWITKTFRIEDFFRLPYVNDTGGAPWAANISANFWTKSKRPYWYTKGLGGNWFLEKTRSRKSCDTVPLIWSVMYTHTMYYSM